METSVQLVTTPAMRTACGSLGVGAGRVIRSSTAVALKSLMLGKERTRLRSVEVKSAWCYVSFLCGYVVMVYGAGRG
jgi:hypothetical protein